MMALLTMPGLIPVFLKMTKWVLTQLIHRAYTTDTSLIAIADSKEQLEKYFDTILEKARAAHNDEDYVNYFNSTFQINEVMYLEEM